VAEGADRNLPALALIAGFTWISMVALHLIRREDAKIQPGG